MYSPKTFIHRGFSSVGYGRWFGYCIARIGYIDLIGN
jgi:hypothetical protein